MRSSRALLACVALVIASAASAQTASLDGIRFLVGRWTAGEGAVADTGQRSTGTSVITEETGGTSLLRRDHTDLFDATGKPMGGFDQIMLMYPDGGAIHADYFDGQHVIHYTKATVTAGRSVVFDTGTVTGRPAFRLSYDLENAATLRVTFEIAPPGQTTFNPIASGTLKRAP